MVTTSTILMGLLAPVQALNMYPDNKTSIYDAMNTVIEGTMTYCPWYYNKSGAAPAMFQEPYYWWEAGVAWSALLDFQAYTNNNTFDHWIRQALVLQSGAYWNYMTENQTSVEGNDDQAFWGIAAMNAAEKNLTRASAEYPPWLYFAEATFNTMAARWDNTTCNGGLRWQIFQWNSGYTYKNMVSNGCLFHLAARLTRFTNNETYIEWAERVWNWADEVKLLNPLNPNASNYSQMSLQVLDGAHDTRNCTDISKSEWTYDQGLMISGCAYLYNYTGDSKWLDRVDALWSRATVLFGNDNSSFFPGNYILYEPSCMTADESIMRCSNDQRCFKGIMLSFLGYSMQVVPELKEKFWPYVQTSAQAASWSCSGGTDGHTCGLSWLHQGWDGQYGLGEQLCALSAFNTLLYDQYGGPYKASDLPEVYTPTKNTSQIGGGNGSTEQGGGTVYGWGGLAGVNSTDVTAKSLNITQGDKAGAGVLTAFVIIFIVSGSVWIIL